MSSSAHSQQTRPRVKLPPSIRTIGSLPSLHSVFNSTAVGALSPLDNSLSSSSPASSDASFRRQSPTSTTTLDFPVLELAPAYIAATTTKNNKLRNAKSNINLTDRAQLLTPAPSFELDTRASPITREWSLDSGSDVETTTTATDASFPATPSPLFRAGNGRSGRMGSRVRVTSLSQEESESDLNVLVESPSKEENGDGGVDVEAVTSQMAGIGLGLLHEDTDSRFIKIANVAPSVIPDYIKNVFAKFGAVKGVCTEVQQSLGLVFVAFFDVRHARAAYNALMVSDSRLMEVHLPAKAGASKVEVSFFSPKEMSKFVPPQAMAEVSGKVIIKITESLSTVDEEDIKYKLTSIGDLRDFSGDAEQGYRAEFFDCRHATFAIEKLNDYVFANARLSVTANTEDFPTPGAGLGSIDQPTPHAPQLFAQPPTNVPAYHDQPTYPSAYSSPTPFYPHALPSGVVTPNFTGPRYFNPSVWPFPDLRTFTSPSPGPVPHHSLYPVPPASQYGYANYHAQQSPFGQVYPQQWYDPSVHPSPAQAPVPLRGVSSPPRVHAQELTPRTAAPYAPPPAAAAPLHRQSGPQAAVAGTTRGVPEGNVLHLSKIESGEEMRTTVMIKNIPNRMSDKELLALIDDVCPRAIDFFYLRVDFKTGCNVGYAFVNFINVQDVYKFASTKLGTPWNVHASAKCLEMCFAAYQGKAALVDKFRNSSVMDVQPEWRPKVFVTEGRDRGLPEPFPEATHMRRKQLSAQNRGALYVSNPTTSGAGQGQEELLSPVSFPSIRSPSSAYGFRGMAA